MNKPVYFDTYYGLLKKIHKFNNGYYLYEVIDILSFLEEYFYGILKESIQTTINILSKGNYDDIVHNSLMKVKLDINYIKNNDCVTLSGSDCKKLCGDFYCIADHKGLLRHIGFDYHKIKKQWCCNCFDNYKCKNNKPINSVTLKNTNCSFHKSICEKTLEEKTLKRELEIKNILTEQQFKEYMLNKDEMTNYMLRQQEFDKQLKLAQETSQIKK